MNKITIDLVRPHLARSAVTNYANFQELVYYDLPEFAPNLINTYRFYEMNESYSRLIKKIDKAINKKRTVIKLNQADAEYLMFACAFYLGYNNSLILGMIGSMPAGQDEITRKNLMTSALNLLYNEIGNNQQMSQDKRIIFRLLVELV